MDIPKRLKIGGHTVRVEVGDDTVTNNYAGEDWSLQNLIRINGNYPQSRQESILLHEILHHIVSDLGYQLKDTATDGYVHSELVLGGLAEALYQVLRTNKLNFHGKKVKS